MGLAQLMRKVSPVFQAAAADEESNLDLLGRLAISKLIKPPPPAQPLPQLDPRRYPMDERLPDGRSVTEAVSGLSGPGFGAPRNDSMEVRTGQLEGMAPPALDGVQEPVQAQLATRPRRVLPEVVEEPTAPELEPFGSSGEVFGSARPRRTQPRDYVADDEAYLRDLRNAPVERSRLKSFGLAALRGLANGPGGAIGGGLVGMLDPELYGRGKRNREIKRAEANLEGSLTQQKVESGQLNEASLRDYRAAQANVLRRRPDLDASRIETQRRQTLAALYNRLPEFDPEDPVNAEMVSAMTAAGLPVVPKSRAQQLKFVQDARSGQWTIISGDRATGQATAQSVTTAQGAPAITTPTAQLSAENQAANRASRERLAGAGIASREKIAAQNRQARLSGRPSTRGKIQPGEDPDVRAYANDYFNGDYQAAIEAISKQKRR